MKKVRSLAKNGTHMNIDTNKIGSGEQGDAGPRFGLPNAFWQRLLELWLLGVLVAFFFIRVLGSHTAQRLIERFLHTHLP
ncbi:MAG: hypothetical protein WA765_17035 [Candidatus Acidiferrum sp.]